MCDQGCQKSEVRHVGSSSAASSSDDGTIWLDPSESNLGCNRCKKPRKHCRCRFANVTILPCIPKGAIPIGNNCYPKNNCNPNIYPSHCPTPPSCQPFNGEISMQVPINPMENLVGLDSGLNNGYIMIQMRCLPNNVVVFQWEPFEGQVGANNIKSVTMNAMPGPLPIYYLEQTVRVELNGDIHVGYLSVKNQNGPNVFQFHFKASNDLKAKIGDSLKVNGGSATWVRC